MQRHFALDVQHGAGGLGDVVDAAAVVAGEGIGTRELDLWLGLGLAPVFEE